MTGTVPVSGQLSLQQLADTLTKYEQYDFQRVTGLVADHAGSRNLVTLTPEPQRLGRIAVASTGSTGSGVKFLSAIVYVSGVETHVDLYRLPIAPE